MECVQLAITHARCAHFHHLRRRYWPITHDRYCPIRDPLPLLSHAGLRHHARAIWNLQNTQKPSDRAQLPASGPQRLHARWQPLLPATTRRGASRRESDSERVVGQRGTWPTRYRHFQLLLPSELPLFALCECLPSERFDEEQT